jgi:hypothetical protein
MNKTVFHNCIDDIRFMGNTFIPKGAECSIKMVEGSSSTVEVSEQPDGKPYKMNIRTLYRHFREFDSISEEEIDQMSMDGDNPSIYLLSECGNLEPDGSDEFGFPSKTLALI